MRDPDAHERGFSLKGIEVPLVNYCPVQINHTILNYDDTPAAANLDNEYWDVPCELLIKARPQIRPYLRGIDQLLIPTSWCDVAPTLLL